MSVPPPPSPAADPVASAADAAGFAAFTPAHALVVLVAAAILLAVLRAGRRWRRTAPAAERRLRLAFAASIVAGQIASLAFWLAPSRFDPTISLPLHVCDLVPWIAAAALAAESAGWRWLRTITWFWGIGLSAWGFIWPVLTKGPDRLEFWLFWMVHLQIVGAAVYLVAVAGWRPLRGDLRLAAVGIGLYVLAITPVNLLLAADYGYVGPADGPTGILGPWPWRVPVVVAGEVLIFAGLAWILTGPGRRTGGRSAPDANPDGLPPTG